jgi:hypothetical protein
MNTGGVISRAFAYDYNECTIICMYVHTVEYTTTLYFCSWSAKVKGDTILYSSICWTGWNRNGGGEKDEKELQKDGKNDGYGNTAAVRYSLFQF